MPSSSLNNISRIVTQILSSTHISLLKVAIHPEAAIADTTIANVLCAAARTSLRLISLAKGIMFKMDIKFTFCGSLGVI